MSHELENSLAIHCYTAFQKIMNSVSDPLLFDEIPSPYQQKWFAFARSILNRYHVDLSLTCAHEDSYSAIVRLDGIQSQVITVCLDCKRVIE